MIGLLKSAVFKRFLNVGFYQAISQLVNAVTGFLIIRSLDKVDYAAYALFFSLLSTISMISGIGIHIGMSVIGGRVWEDRAGLGQLIRTLEGLRMMLFKWLVVPFAAYTFWLFHKNGLSLAFAGCSLAVVLATIWLQIHANLKFDVAKLLNRVDIINYYDLVPAIMRLTAVLGILFFLPGKLLLILLVTFFSYLIQYWMINRQVEKLYEPAIAANPEYRKEALSLMRSEALNTVYFVFQGQVVIILLSIFLDVTAISDVTALGRVMVIFSILNSTLMAVVTPAFAREQDLGKLKAKFFQSSAAYIAIMAAMCIVTYFFPKALLWILGDKYAGLGSELFVMVLGACFFQYVCFMYSFIASKGWMKYQWLYTPLTIINQLILILTLDLHTQMGIIWFGALSNFGFFLINCFSLGLGFLNKDAKPKITGKSAL